VCRHEDNAAHAALDRTSRRHESGMRNVIVAIWVLTVVTTGCSGKGHVLEVAGDTFESEVLQSATPVVVEFWAHGCLPCMTLARPLERVAREYEGRVAFRKLNAGWTAKTRYLYKFDAVPTLIFYLDGREVARLVGRPDGDVHDGLVSFVEAGLAAPRGGAVVDTLN
jgi:thioredoxin 1